MLTNPLYHTWFFADSGIATWTILTQVRNFVWLVVGIFQSRSVGLSRIVGKVPGPAKLLSMTRRLSRLLADPVIRVREWYEPVTRESLDRQFRNLGEVRSIVDGTKIGFGHQLLIVCMTYCR